MANKTIRIWNRKGNDWVDVLYIDNGDGTFSQSVISDNGTDITNPTAMPAGGSGLRGWLSAIWTKLNATLAVTGTFWQAIQPTSDAGPAQTVTRTPFTSDDCHVTPVDLTTAPGTGLKAVAMDIIVSVDTACELHVLTESGSDLFSGFLPASSGFQQVTPRGYIKGATAAKKLQITTSVAAKVRGICNWFTEV